MSADFTEICRSTIKPVAVIDLRLPQDNPGREQLIPSRIVKFTLQVRDKQGRFRLVPFILDTGTSISTIPDEIAASLGFPAKPRRRMARFATATGDDYQASLVELSFQFQRLPGVLLTAEFGRIPKTSNSNEKQFIKALRIVAEVGIQLVRLFFPYQTDRVGLLSLKDVTEHFDVLLTDEAFALRPKLAPASAPSVAAPAD